MIFSIIKGNAISGNTFTVLGHNVRSLPRYVDDIVSDNRTINNNIIRFTEKKINPSYSTSKTTEMLNFFKQ